MTEPVDTLVFDGDCGFCTASVEWLRPRLKREVRIIPYQRLHLDSHGLTLEDAREFAWWIAPDGSQSRGYQAVGKSLMACGGGWRLAGWLMLIPPFQWLAAPGYTLVSKYRHRLPGSTPACRRPSGGPG